MGKGLRMKDGVKEEGVCHVYEADDSELPIGGHVKSCDQNHTLVRNHRSLIFKMSLQRWEVERIGKLNVRA